MRTFVVMIVTKAAPFVLFVEVHHCNLLGENMGGEEICPECGCEIPEGSPGGLCPSCLLRISTVDSSSQGNPKHRFSNSTSELGEKENVMERFRIISTLGQGGMGTVYLAEQVIPIRRRVALKVIRTGMEIDPIISRFRAEGQALAVMDHPNVAKVYEVGDLEKGAFYLAMELVEITNEDGERIPGLPLTEYCNSKRLKLEDRLDLFSQACRGVHHANLKGVIHRDLKPSNILVGEVDGKPLSKVIDFGIAKDTRARLVGDTLYTQTGQLIGTPQYMSPEQASGISGAVDVRSDIYALGTVLYELLCGEAPIAINTIKSASLEEILRIIREDDPLKLSARVVATTEGNSGSGIAFDRQFRSTKQLIDSLSGELDWIVSKALEKEPDRRHQGAEKLAEDVEAFVSGSALPHSGPPSKIYRFKKLIRRNRVVARFALVTVLLLMATGVTGIFLKRAQHGEEQMTDLWRSTHATASFAKGEYDKGLEKLEEILADTKSSNLRFDTLERLSDEMERRGRLEEASKYQLEMVEMMAGVERGFRPIEPLNSDLVVAVMNETESLLERAGQSEEMEVAIRKILPTFQKLERARVLERGKVSEIIVSEGAEWRGFDGAEAGRESGLHQEFFHPDFDDANWPKGNGIRFGHHVQGSETKGGIPLNGDEVHLIFNSTGPLYLRHRFNLLHQVENVELRIQVNEGVIVYMDGMEVARRNAVSTNHSANSSTKSTVGEIEKYMIHCYPIARGLAEGEHLLALMLPANTRPGTESKFRQIKVKLVAIEKP